MGMKVNYTTKGDGFPSMIKRLQAIDGSGVEVGVLKGKHAWLASIHEYGCDIAVTEKMRAFLHYNGLHLSPETTEIHIPERSFLRAGYDKNQNDVLQKAQRMLADVATGRTSENALYSGVGLELSSKIKDYAVGLSSPGNHPFTTDRKGSGNPLVDSGDLIGGITWRKAK
jgi:hypothetical protein